MNTQRGGKEEDCSHPRKEVWEGEVEQVEQEQVVEPVAQEDETPTGCAIETLHHEDERFPLITTAQINQLMNESTEAGGLRGRGNWKVRWNTSNHT